MHWSLSFGGPYHCFWLLGISSGFYLVVRIPFFAFWMLVCMLGRFSFLRGGFLVGSLVLVGFS